MKQIEKSDGRCDRAGRVFSQWFNEIQEKWLAKWLSDTKKLISPECTFSDDYIKSELVYQAIYMAGLFKGGYFPAYADLYVAKLAARVLLREWRRMELHVELGDYETQPCKSLGRHLGESDLARQVQRIADQNGLGRIAELLKTMTEREIAEELGQTQPAVHKKVEKLRRLCKRLV